MSELEFELKVSLIQIELAKIAEQLELVRPKAARVLRYAAGVLNLVGATSPSHLVRRRF